MTFTQKAAAAGIIVPEFLEEVTLADGSHAVWMGDHWMVTGCR